MSVVYACIAPHGGNLLLGEDAPSPVPGCRKAMAQMRRSLEDSRPEAVAILTPHGIGIEGAISLGVTRAAYGELDGVKVRVKTDLDLACAWEARASDMGVPIAALTPQALGGALPLDWGVTIPLLLLTPTPLPTVVACPARDVARSALVDWGEALVEAALETKRRVALIVSADQGHGHAADGPYGLAPASAEYDAAMQAAIAANDLPRLLDWPEDWPETALADSYWQTLSLIGVQKRVPLRSRFLAYEVDHYFGLLCAEFIVP